MKKTKARIVSIRNFLTDNVWHDLSDEASKIRQFGQKALRVLIIVYRDFGRDNCMLRASALTYATLLAIVPLLAFAFAVLKGLGVQNKIEPLIIENLAVGSQEVVSKIIEYINNTNVGQLGSVGLGMLLLTVLALLSNVEKSFNSVWGVSETRTLLRRFADYFSVVAFGPLLVVVAMSMTASLQNNELVLTLQSKLFIGDLIRFAFKILPYVAMWIAFTFLYLFMPNIRVRVPAAIVGGVIGGTLWQLVQIGYVLFQVGVSRYNAIYGTMAALPIIMVWIYLSWMIVLFGLEITSTIQNLQNISHRIRSEKEQLWRHDFIGLALLLAVTRTFIQGDAPLSVEHLAARLNLLPGQVIKITNELMTLGYLTKVSRDGNEEGFVPLQSPENIVIKDLLSRFRGELPDAQNDKGRSDWSLIRELSVELADAETQVLDGMTVYQLAQKTAGTGGVSMPVQVSSRG
ncbi:MAG: YihY/virulence factor BrkB family protein [Desulfuromonadales bacterium]|nr:YihY/virulence factor BrkB family protein [Desulfuromonadales bacterium]